MEDYVTKEMCVSNKKTARTMIGAIGSVCLLSLLTFATILYNNNASTNIVLIEHEKSVNEEITQIRKEFQDEILKVRAETKEALVIADKRRETELGKVLEKIDNVLDIVMETRLAQVEVQTKLQHLREDFNEQIRTNKEIKH